LPDGLGDAYPSLQANEIGNSPRSVQETRA
jgi:hypothetical protein